MNQHTARSATTAILRKVGLQAAADLVCNGLDPTSSGSATVQQLQSTTGQLMWNTWGLRHR